MAGILGDTLANQQLVDGGNNPQKQTHDLQVIGADFSYDAANERLVMTVNGASNVLAALAGQTLSIGGLTITASGSTVYQVITGKGQTTDGSTITLATLPIGASSVADIYYRIMARIEPDTSTLLPATWRRIAIVKRAATGSPAGVEDADAADVSMFSRPFLAASDTLGTAIAGAPSLAISGNSLLVQATGLAAPAAFQTGGHSYVLGDLVTNGGKLYVVTTAGTGDATTGPSGTGSSIANGPDTLVFAWVTSSLTGWSGAPTISWTVVAAVRVG